MPFETLALLVPALPLAAAIANAIIGLGGRRVPDRVVGRITVAATSLAFVAAVGILVGVAIDPRPRVVTVMSWLASGDLTVNVALLVDPLSAVMVVVITSIGALVARFSINYMHNEVGFARYFTVLALFLAAMLLLVMSSSYALMFVGWEAVGVCSYLLIGFYLERPSAARAGTKAFVMTRIGDAGFLVGIFLLVDSFGSTDFDLVFAQAAAADPARITAICLSLLVGAIGKSAQLPLTTWLARAMEGPTPSSALIHAATMVTAGVYLLARSAPLYDHAPAALAVVTLVGAATAIYSGVLGLVQTDIKSVLAYSTTAQLGLMLVACGLGAYAIAVFHLAAHAFFKTYLFLTAPSILHALHGARELRETERAPTRVGRIAIVGAAGVVLIGAGAYAALGAGAWTDPLTGTVLAVITGAAALTAGALVARMVDVHVVQGDRGARQTGNRRVRLITPALLGLGLLVTAGVALGIVPGGLSGTWFSRLIGSSVPAAPHLPGVNVAVQSALVVVFLFGIGVSWYSTVRFDRFRPEPRVPASRLGRAMYRAAVERFWLDELYAALAVRPVHRLAAALDRFDTDVLNRAIVGGTTRLASSSRTLALPFSAAGAIDGVTAQPSLPGAEPERDSKSAPGFLNRLTTSLGGIAARVEHDSEVTPGFLYRLTTSLGGVAARVEHDSQAAPGLLDRLITSLGGLAARIEHDSEAALGLVNRLAVAGGRGAAWAEEVLITRTATSLGSAGARFEPALLEMEEALARPAVFGALVAGSLLLAGTVAILLSAP